MSDSIVIALVEEGIAPQLRWWLEVAEGVATLRRLKMSLRAEVIKSVRQRDDFVERIKADPPDILFLPVYRDQLHGANALLLGLRKSDLPTAIVVGGTLGTLGADVFTFNPVPNAVLLGDWQPLLYDFAMKFYRFGTGADLAGVWWRGPKGWQITPPNRQTGDLEAFDDADFGALPINDLLKVNGRTMPLLASRGCAYSCAFCHVPMLRKLERPESHYRLHPPRRVVDQARALVQKHDARAFVFTDELFPWHDNWIETFSVLWREEVNLPFRWTTCAEQVTPNNLRLLKDAGGTCMEIGIETGDEQRRAAVTNRNVREEDIRRAIGWARQRDIRVAVNMILGWPRESRNDLVATVEMANSLKGDETNASLLTRWPAKANWSETEHAGLELTGLSIRGGSASDTIESRDHEVMRDLSWAMAQLRNIDMWGRVNARGAPSRDGTFDGLHSLASATFRSQLANPIKVDTYHAANGSHQVLALRVPTEVSWEVELPPSPVLEFGVLLEPTLPGLRSKLPIGFSVKLRQEKRVFRLFQKVLIQALDPDSRRWHHFAIPLEPSQPGPAIIVIDNLVFGRDASYLPPEGDVWAGWCGLTIRSRSRDSGVATIAED